MQDRPASHSGRRWRFARQPPLHGRRNRARGPESHPGRPIVVVINRLPKQKSRNRRPQDPTSPTRRSPQPRFRVPQGHKGDRKPPQPLCAGRRATQVASSRSGIQGTAIATVHFPPSPDSAPRNAGRQFQHPLHGNRHCLAPAFPGHASEQRADSKAQAALAKGDHLEKAPHRHGARQTVA